MTEIDLTQAIENLKRLSEAIRAPEKKRERNEETMKNETEENITKLRETMISKAIESILSDARFFELFLEAYREKGIPDCEIIKQEEVEMLIHNLGQTIKRIEFEIEQSRK